jgi:hypothetical protein
MLCKIPLQDLATKATKQIEDAVVPENERKPSTPAKSKSLSQPRVFTPSRPSTRPSTYIKKLVEDEQDAKSGIRVDSAGLYKKLALIVPPLKTEYQYDDTRHRTVMKAVASCTSLKGAPEMKSTIGKSFLNLRAKTSRPYAVKKTPSRNVQLEYLINLKKDTVLTLADWQELQTYQKQVL